MDKTETWFILGGGGGIGRALVDRVMTHRPQSQVLATHRTPLSSLNPSLQWLTLDFTDADWQATLMNQLPATAARIDRFVACTGVLSDATLKPEKRLKDLDPEQMQRAYQVNAVGPLAAFAAVADRLAVAPNPVAAFLSAQVGSIEDNRTGGWYGYRMAKAALNMGVKNLAIETGRWRNPAVVMAVHPGTTRSELSKPFTRRRKPVPRSAEDTAKHLFNRMTEGGTAHHGQLITAEGGPLPW